ncbi:FMN-dependent NADH-azoreductase [uncultured Eubacterium sp.]|uniref:NAD(P)H-dependent oxidoreductase n=1 Tax=Emergencia sp. TaxID=1926557 RepID=UPI00082327DD|nr:FMN-dependent NADH-azoreductase [uncultured Eubacterium sp.]
MEKLLFIDACISTHASRTKRLCTTYIDQFMKKNPEVTLETVVLRKGKVEPLTKERIIERDNYIKKKDWNQPMFDFAKQFQEADYVVVGTPYWDLSFASILKVYIENIMVADLTFEATNTGFVGLCKGKQMVYITTAGGFIGDKNFGYDYMCGVADMFGIPETELIKAEALDIEGFDAEKIMEKAIEEVKQRF